MSRTLRQGAAVVAHTPQGQLELEDPIPERHEEEARVVASPANLLLEAAHKDTAPAQHPHSVRRNEARGEAADCGKRW